MKPISPLLVIAGMGLASAAGAEIPASEAARVALAEKADLPSLRPVLPSLLGDRDSTNRNDQDDRQGPWREAKGEAEKDASSAAVDAHAAADARKAAREAARAEADQQSASEKAHAEKVKKEKKDHGKPPPKK